LAGLDGLEVSREPWAENAFGLGSQGETGEAGVVCRG